MNSLGVLASMAVLLVVVTLLLSRPWWPRSKSDGRPLRAAANVAVYRQRLLEIDADEAAGLLDEATARQLRDEHAARLLQDADDVAPGVTPVQTGRTWALLILLPIFAVGTYAASGRWPMAEKIEQARVDPDVASELALEHGLEQLVQHLEAQPDDAEAWARLGEIELSRGRSDAAASAYAKATALVPDRGDWWAAEGEALAMAQSQDLRGAPAGRFERALVLSPDNSKALFYGGMVAAQSGDFALASQRWRRLKQQGASRGTGELHRLKPGAVGPAGRCAGAIAGSRAVACRESKGTGRFVGHTGNGVGPGCAAVCTGHVDRVRPAGRRTHADCGAPPGRWAGRIPPDRHA